MMTTTKIYSLILSVALICAPAFSARASSTDPLIEGAKLCTRHLGRYETQYGIPSHLLSAIASTESGRYHEGLKIKLPWPWTINAEGKGYFFDSKEEAIAAARRLYNSGVQSMDVGCMQVNLRHHPEAFTSLSEAFEPQNNVAYAASFLRNLYQEDGSWKKAASNYHSKTPSLGEKYIGLVYNSWFKIIDKLRAAKLSVPGSSEVALNQMKAEANEAPTSAPVQQAQATPSPKYIDVAAATSPAKPAYKPTKLNSIKVHTQGMSSAKEERVKRDNGIIVIKPQIKVVAANDSPPAQISPPQPTLIADASAALSPAPQPPTDTDAKIIRLDNKSVDRIPVNTQIVRKSGPNFIFND